MKNKVKVTVVESYKVYQWKHYEVDEEIIVKQFGSIKHLKEKDLSLSWKNRLNMIYVRL